MKNVVRSMGGVLALALWTSGCATQEASWSSDWTRGTRASRQREELDEVEERRPQAAAPAPREPAVFRPRAFVASYPNPAECEAAARTLLTRSPDTAWAALQACVAHTRFTSIRALLSADWVDEVRTRPDAGPLLAQVIAHRGGSVAPDLALLHDARVPVFSLGAALSQPGVYRGRYVVLRARVTSIQGEAAQPTVQLVESTLGNVGSDQQVGRKLTATSNVSGTVQASGSYRNNAGLSGSGSGRASFSGQKTTDYMVTERRYDNVVSETGVVALGRLAKADPFLVPGKEFIVLARFDGVRRTPGSGEGEDAGPKVTPIVTVFNYFEPNPLVVY